MVSDVTPAVSVAPVRVRAAVEAHRVWEVSAVVVEALAAVAAEAVGDSAAVVVAVAAAGGGNKS